jgi:hypothetical protein
MVHIEEETAGKADLSVILATRRAERRPDAEPEPRLFTLGERFAQENDRFWHCH